MASQRGQSPYAEQKRASLRISAVPFTKATWGRVVELADGINAACTAEVGVYLRELGLGSSDPSLKVTILANMAGRMVHERALDPPLGRTTAECAEEIVNACLGYLSRSSSSRIAEKKV